MGLAVKLMDLIMFMNVHVFLTLLWYESTSVDIFVPDKSSEYRIM